MCVAGPESGVGSSSLPDAGRNCGRVAIRAKADAAIGEHLGGLLIRHPDVPRPHVMSPNPQWALEGVDIAETVLNAAILNGASKWARTADRVIRSRVNGLHGAHVTPNNPDLNEIRPELMIRSRNNKSSCDCNYWRSVDFGRSIVDYVAARHDAPRSRRDERGTNDENGKLFRATCLFDLKTTSARLTEFYLASSARWLLATRPLHSITSIWPGSASNRRPASVLLAAQSEPKSGRTSPRPRSAARRCCGRSSGRCSRCLSTGRCTRSAPSCPTMPRKRSLTLSDACDRSRPAA